MGVRIIENRDDNYAVLYCSTSMTAFGPVFCGGWCEAEAFIKWLPQDARKYNDSELHNQYSDFIEQKDHFVLRRDVGKWWLYPPNTELEALDEDDFSYLANGDGEPTENDYDAAWGTHISNIANEQYS